MLIGSKEIKEKLIVLNIKIVNHSRNIMQEIEKLLSICELDRNRRYSMVIVNQAKYYEYLLEGVLSINPMNLIKSYCSQFKERFNIFELLAELSDFGI